MGIYVQAAFFPVSSSVLFVDAQAPKTRLVVGEDPCSYVFFVRSFNRTHRQRETDPARPDPALGMETINDAHVSAFVYMHVAYVYLIAAKIRPKQQNSDSKDEGGRKKRKEKKLT